MPKKLQKVKSKKTEKKPIKTKKTKEAKASKKEVVKEAPPQKFPEDPVFLDLLYQIAGVQATTVARTLFGNEMTDEELSKRTGISINLVRRILYELYDNRLVSYKRLRDEDSGWYIYYWQMNPDRGVEHIKENRRQLLQKLEEKLEEERNTVYFVCRNNDPKVPYDVATETEFKCPRCSKKLEPYDNSNAVVALERRVQLLKEQVAHA